MHCTSVTICAYRFYILNEHTDEGIKQVLHQHTYNIFEKSHTLLVLSLSLYLYFFLSQSEAHFLAAILHPLICFYSICTGPSKNQQRVFGHEKKNHKSPRSFVYYKIQYFIFICFQFFFILGSLLFSVFLVHTLSAPSLNSFVLDAFLWDSWLQ